MAFTLRFHNPDTHRRLRLVAEAMGLPMREIAEAAVMHELDILEASLEDRLERVLARIRADRRTRASLEGDIEAFAEAEAEHQDPLVSTRAKVEEDSYGVSEIFANLMEQR